MKEKQQCCFVSNAALWSSVSMFALMVSVRTCVNSPVPEERCIFLYVPAMACCMHPWDLKYPFLLHPHQRDNSTINNRWNSTGEERLMTGLPICNQQLSTISKYISCQNDQLRLADSSHHPKVKNNTWIATIAGCSINNCKTECCKACFFDGW